MTVFVTVVKKRMRSRGREKEREMGGEERGSVSIPAEGGGEEKKQRFSENHSVMKN